jgi:xylulokinase
MSTIGLDLGTSGVRAVAFDERGRQLAEAVARTELRRPRPGWVVVDAEAVLQVAENVITSVSATCAGLGDPVLAIAYSSQGEAVVPVDGNGHAMAAAPVGMDCRGDAAFRAIAERLGSQQVQEITGQPLHPMFSLYKLAVGDSSWRSPVTAAYRTLGDFVLSRWGARPATDWTLAARTGMFDVGSTTWSDTVLGAAAEEAPWLADLTFSDPVLPGTALGSVSAAVAERLGVGSTTMLVAGLHDQAASFVGAGGCASVISTFALGSSDCLTVETPERPARISGTGFATYPWRPGRWITLAGTAAGGWALEWFATLTGFADPAELLRDIAPEPPEAVVLPYLAGSGTLDNDPAARGAIAGLTLALTRPQLTRAFVEAAGYELAAIVDAFGAAGVEIGQLRAVGTGAGDPATLGIRVDAAALPLTPTYGNASARGAALLAAESIGRLDLIDPLPIDLGPTQLPTPTTADWYARQRRTYRDLSHALRPIIGR